VFPQESQEHFVNVFNNPPLTAKEERDAREKDAVVADKGKSKWKAVEVAPKEDIRSEVEPVEEDVDGEPMDQDDVDGEPMDDEDIDGIPMEDDDVDGAPMEADTDGEPMEEDQPPPAASELILEAGKASSSPAKADSATVGQPRRRPRAVDMFADSDDED